MRARVPAFLLAALLVGGALAQTLTPAIDVDNPPSLAAISGAPSDAPYLTTGAVSGLSAEVPITTSASLRGVITDESGTGAALFAGGALGAASATSLSFSSTSGIIGTTTSDSAAAGSVGEVISSTVAFGSAVSLSTGAATTITSIDLTAGDWDVTSHIAFFPAATTSVTVLESGINTTTNAINNAVAQYASNARAASVPGANIITQDIPDYRVSLAGTTTYYIVARATFTVSTMTAYGIIRARRVR